MLRRLLRAAIVLVALFLVFLIITAVQVWSASRRDEARRVQAIVVFGAAQYDGRPSPVLKARLDHAIALYRRGYADSITVTGGRRPGDRYTEAQASALYLTSKGVPDGVVLREVAGRNSWESLAATAVFLKARGVTHVLLVSDRFHSLRIAAMAKELGLEGWTSPAANSPIAGVAQLPYLAKETVAVAAGRVIGFRRLMRVERGVRQAAMPLRHGARVSFEPAGGTPSGAEAALR